MKKFCLIGLAFLGVILFASPGRCEEKSKAAGGEVKAAGPAKARKAKAEGRKGSPFVGAVVWADTDTKSITLKGRGKIVTFDASNPTFRGYRSLGDVREGSYCAVSYTSTGLRISRATRGEAALEPAPDIPAATKTAKKDSKKRIARIALKGTGFYDVDENKDGKVTAVEMSVVLSDLTMDQFKNYDKNGDGCLSEPEYRAALRNR